MKFNHTAHRALWKWLSKNPEKREDHWVGFALNGGELTFPLPNWSFCCEYVAKSTGTWGDWLACDMCPLLWGEGDKDPSPCKRILFSLEKAKTSRKRSSLCRQIANLPVKPGVDCE